MKIAKKTHVATVGAFDWAGIFGVVCELDCSYEVKISRGEWTLVYIIFASCIRFFIVVKQGAAEWLFILNERARMIKKRKKKTVT